MVISHAGVLQAPRHAEADVVQDEVHDGEAHPRLLTGSAERRDVNMPKREEKREVRRAEDEDESERPKIYLAASVMNGWTRGDLLGADSVKKGPCYLCSLAKSEIYPA